MMAKMKLAKLGSRVKVDPAPGAFIDNDTLRQLMMEEGRPRIGGPRIYGSEYDNYWQNRRWQFPSRAPDPTFTPTPTPEQARRLVKKAAQNVAKRIVARAKTRVKAEARAEGKPPSEIGAAPFETYLTAEDIGCPTPGAKIRSRGRRRGMAVGRGAMRQMSGFGHLGEDELPEPDDVDLLTAVREIYGTTKDLKPLTSFIADHPIGTIAILMMVVGIWAGIASFVGAGGVDVLKQLLKAKE